MDACAMGHFFLGLVALEPNPPDVAAECGLVSSHDA